MKIPRPPHRWDLSPTQAIAVQRRLASRVLVRPLRRRPRLVAGLDCAFSGDGAECIAGAVVWDVDAGEIVEQRFARRPLAFPYVPGLLSFREAPALLAVLRALRARPDALLLDGHGIAHPRRFGIACHVGVLADLPAAGCAKSLLVGEHSAPGSARGARTALRHGGERVGTALRTRPATRPVYVSVGHRIDLAGAEALVLACGAGYRLPEPTRRADQLVGAVKRTRGPRAAPADAGPNPAG